MSLAAPGTNPASNLELKLPHTIGSANQLLKVDGSGQLGWADDNSGLSLSNDANNRVVTGTGSGLNAEANLTFDGSLVVTDGNGTVTTGGNYINLKRTTSGTNYINAPLADADLVISADENLLFHTVHTGDFNSTERMRINSSGKVGINESSPDSKLHITGGSNEHITLKLEPGGTAGNYSEIVLGRTSSAPAAQTTPVVKGGIPVSGVPGILFGSENTNLPAIGFQTPNSSNGHIVFSPKGSEKLRIDSSGRVLIGLNANHANASIDDLQVGNPNSSTQTGITIGSSDECAIAFSDAGDARAGSITYNHGSNIMIFKTEGQNERLSITSEKLSVGGKTSYAAFRTHSSRGLEWNLNAINSPQNHSSGISGWVFLGHDYGANPYPVRTFKIATPEGGNNVIGTRVYQVWHDGDSNYDYGGLWEVRINQWNNSSRFESVSIRCVNGKRDDLCVRAYDDTNGIMIRPSTIWGAVYLRLAGYDSSQGYRGSSHCAVANNGALAIYNAQGTDNGTVPTSGNPVDVFPFDGHGGSHSGGRDIENTNWFNG